MEARDTVMPFMRIEEIDAKNATSNFTDALIDVAREQAEISFKVGYEEGIKVHARVIETINPDSWLSGRLAGIKEVVEWLDNQYDGSEDMWQAFLKSKGIK